MVREAARGGLDGNDRALEFAAGVGRGGRLPEAVERRADVVFAADERQAVGEEADHRDQRDRDDPGPD